MPWRDPLIPVIQIPEDLKSHWYRLGSARYQLLPKQYEFAAAQEEFIGYISGVGGGKTKIGSIASTYLSMYPNNRGLVGRFALPDLEDTTQRDLLDFLHEAQLLKEAPNSKNKRALVHCVDPVTGKNLGYTSEISFQHLDDPDHLRGRHLGWFWIDEGSELRSNKAWVTLVTRLRLPAFRNRYKAMVTGNPKGHNWVWEFFFNQEHLETVICNRPGCPYPPKVCNEHVRKKRRALHCVSWENYFLPPEYLENMVASMTDEQRRREIEAEFDVFEGQVFKEFRRDIHVIQPPESWIEGRPPKEWNRLLAVDVGGSSPWAFIWCAVDPVGNLIFYDEIYLITSNVDQLAELALPKMKDENRNAYNFQAKVIDYENKIAAEDLRRRGIAFSNARKMNKSGDGGSVSRLSSYLHPNPKHHYPEYHHMAGQPYSPRAFITTGCPNLIRELPQQQWETETVTDRLRDTMDRRIDNHAVDCLHGDTKVLTDSGILPIRRLVGTTGRVLTPEGWANYLGAEKTRVNSETVTLTFSDGKTVRCTPDHLFLTPTGWVKAQDMMGCLCYISDPWKSSIFSGSDTENIAANGISVAVSADYTGLSGSTTTARFRRDGMSITRMGTATTTQSAIWNWLKLGRTLVNTAVSTANELANTSMLFGLLPHFGMEAQKASNGIVSIGTNAYQSFSWNANWSAAGVPGRLLSGLHTSDQNICVRTTVEQQSVALPESMTSREHASSAATNSQSTSTSRKNSVRCIAMEAHYRADTYCLHVDHPIHAFAVNDGIFVHNCALYISRELPHPAELKPVQYQVTGHNKSKISEMYWYSVKQQQEREKMQQGRRPYRIQRTTLHMVD